MPTIAPPSLQSLLLQMRFGDAVLGTGTGFIASTRAGGPMLVTNRHIVTGRHQDTGAPLSKTGGVPDNLIIWHNRAARMGEWLAKREALYDGDTPRWKEHPKLGVRADLVCLPLTDLVDVAVFPYDAFKPGSDIRVGPSDSLSVIGFPFGLTSGGRLAIWSTGFLATEPEIDFDDLPLLLIDCRSRPGQSGSPVVAYRGGGAHAMSDGGTAIYTGQLSRLIGVYSGRINAESDLGRVWKTSALVEVLESA